MMHLIIQFAGPDLDQFHWVVSDLQSDSLDLSWSTGDESNLATIASQNPHPAILLIPQQCVYLTRVELPEKSNRQLLSAIEFQIEDQLAQNIESQHFALGDTSLNPVSVAVVDKFIMQRCLDLSRRYGLRLSQILPEIFLCPMGENVNMLKVGDDWLLRSGPYQGIKCNDSTLNAMLDLLRRETDFKKLD
ncbi:MAG: type II secretion system protein GspL, partial [Pseudomonadota bacterium]